MQGGTISWTPDGYKEGGDMVARHDKPLYVLKPSAQEWSNSIWGFLISEGFIILPADQCIYTRSSSNRKYVSAVYGDVDDMAITGNEIKSEKARISSQWEIEDLITYEYSIGQPAMIESLIALCGMLDCQP